MSFIRHHAIVVTGMEPQISRASDKAVIEGLQVLGPSEEAINGYKSLLICPDGSKEGCDDSNAGDERRSNFCWWLDCNTHLDWVQIVYGNGDYDAKVKASKWDNCC